MCLGWSPHGMDAMNLDRKFPITSTKNRISPLLLRLFSKFRMLDEAAALMTYYPTGTARSRHAGPVTSKSFILCGDHPGHIRIPFKKHALYPRGGYKSENIFSVLMARTFKACFLLPRPGVGLNPQTVVLLTRFANFRTCRGRE